MSERRSLIQGVKSTPTADPEIEKAFIYGTRAGQDPAVPESPTAIHTNSIPPRVAFSSRMRGDFATALKRASLERQLSGTEPNSLQDILEQALEPWLKSNGYIS